MEEFNYIYEVYYNDYDYVDGDVWEDGYHDDYYDYEVCNHVPVKYFFHRNKAVNFIKTHKEKEYFWKRLLVEM